MNFLLKAIFVYLAFLAHFETIRAFSLISRLKHHQPRMSSFASTSSIVSDPLLREVNAWCGVHGLMYTDGDITWTPAPLALTPTPYPKESFDFVSQLQPIWNLLIDRIARDREFLVTELSPVCHADPFTKRVLELFLTIPEKSIRNSLQLAILRSDYMLDYYQDSGSSDELQTVRPLQVEINTISSSFGSLSHKVQRFHRDLLQRYGHQSQVYNLLQQVHDAPDTRITAEEVAQRHEDNLSLPNIAAALAAAHEAYLTQFYPHRTSDTPKQVQILFIVQPGERNQGDQRALEQTLWNNHGVRAEFATMAEIAQLMVREQEITTNSERLLIQRSKSDPPIEISVAYYRAGYTPQDYPSETEWQVRHAIEHSLAVKCPSAGYHLAGTKAVQAALCKPGVLERFFPDNVDAVGQLRSCFAAQYSLGDVSVQKEAEEATDKAIAGNGAAWVLKPQREGGGNNYYNHDLVQFLKEHKGDPILDGFVLMQRIFPRTQTTAFYKQGKVTIGPSISELGVYGTFLSRGRKESVGEEDVLVNTYAGYLLRTKAEGIDEGGVATGYSVLNSIYLV